MAFLEENWREASSLTEWRQKETKISSAPKPVEERHRIDEVRLDGWMRRGNVDGYAGLD